MVCLFDWFGLFISLARSVCLIGLVCFIGLVCLFHWLGLFALSEGSAGCGLLVDVFMICQRLLPQFSSLTLLHSAMLLSRLVIYGGFLITNQWKRTSDNPTCCARVSLNWLNGSYRHDLFG